MDMKQDNDARFGEYIVVKALEDGASVIGMTRGDDTRLKHTEVLAKGEVLVAQFTENISALKIRGMTQVYTAHGVLRSGEED